MKYYIILALWLIGIIGYIKDIVHLTQCDFAPSYKAEVFYIIGAVSPLGAIFGYIDFGK